MEFNKGDKVHYSPKFGKKENGIVKRVSDDGETVFVVYKCGGQWDNYENYTAQGTDIGDLKKGWVSDYESV